MGRLSLVSCSDPVQPPPAGRLGELVSALAAAGYDPDAEAIRELGADGWRRDPRRRAGMLNRAFADPGVEAVVDVSGGDLANEVLSYLDWGTIAANPKPVVGYSDLTCVLNAIVARTGRTAVLWNAMAGLHRGFGVLDAALAGWCYVQQHFCCSSLSCACVVDAGWITRDLASATLARLEKISKESTSLIPASLPPFTPNVNTAQHL